MPEYTELQKDYANYRLERAGEDLKAARLLFDNKNFRIAIIGRIMRYFIQ